MRVASRLGTLASYAFTMAPEKPVSLKDLTILGKENLPSGGGYMILPSQLGYFDLLRLELVLEGREVIYVVKKGAALHPLLRAHLERDSVHAMEFTPGETEISAYRSAMMEAAKSGAVIIYLPSEAATMTAPMTTVPGSKLEFLLKAGIPVLPLHVHRRQDTALPIERRYTDAEAIFNFGILLQGSEANLASYQECLLLLSEQCVNDCPALDLSLGYALIQGFKKHGTRNSVVDGKDEKILRFDKVFATALALSQVVKRETKKARVGIILPPGLGGLICNVAVVMAGKIPVNLNFTAGRAAI
jgi:acyl-[acyl-carrier-protein]-phospholipid O-acyltransferase/long-chain-fatty-acid--[acyl-carrier-protein] ligase